MGMNPHPISDEDLRKEAKILAGKIAHGHEMAPQILQNELSARFPMEPIHRIEEVIKEVLK